MQVVDNFGFVGILVVLEACPSFALVVDQNLVAVVPVGFVVELVVDEVHFELVDHFVDLSVRLRT